VRLAALEGQPVVGRCMEMRVGPMEAWPAWACTATDAMPAFSNRFRQVWRG
jgi:hypothetical protein